jgi:peptidoglycan-N-acetylglucosamine deacetylase
MLVSVSAIYGVMTAFAQYEALAAQAKALAAQQDTKARIARHTAATKSLQQELASTYSWISPVNCSQHPCIALTFDDGPNAVTTSQVLGILEKEQVHASFFVVGSRVAGNEGLLRQMYADGDEIGNHSWSHPDLTTLKPDQVQQQVAMTQAAVEAAGVPAPTLFRPPYGAVNKSVLSNIPLAVMFWNEDPEDWAASNPSQVEQSVESTARPGGVIDMHDIYQLTVNSLDPIIQKLKSEHYQFVTVSQLMGLKPGQQGEYYGFKPQDFKAGGE